MTVLTAAPNFPEGRLFDGYANRWRQIEDIDGIRVVRVKTYIAANKGVIWRARFYKLHDYFVHCGIRKRPDVVCSTSPQFFAAVGGWMLAVCRQRPFIFELGDLWPASIVAVGAMKRSLPVRLLEKLEPVYRRSAAVAALTYAFKRNLVSRGIDAAKISVVRNGVDASRYGVRPRNTTLEAEYGLQDKFVVGYVGTHGMAHALERVVEAADLLKGDDDIRILFAGAGAARDGLIEQAGRLGLSNIVFLPMQPKEHVPNIWSLCDAALVHLKDDPTFTEVIPSKIFEAMGMGLPILISAPEGEATEIVAAEYAGIVLPPEDPPALSAAVRSLRDDMRAGRSTPKIPRRSAALQSRKTG